MPLSPKTNDAPPSPPARFAQRKSPRGSQTGIAHLTSGFVVLVAWCNACTSSSPSPGSGPSSSSPGESSQPPTVSPTGNNPNVSPTGNDPNVSPNQTSLPSSSNPGSSQAPDDPNTPPPTSAPTQPSQNTTGAPSETTGPAVIGSLASFTCPAPPYATSPLSDAAAAVLVEGIPPVDDFVETSDTIVLEGPVWWDGALYLSQINAGSPVLGRPGGFPIMGDAGVPPTPDAGPQEPPSPPPSRLLRVDASGEVTVVLQDAGSNGLALDGEGKLLSANHKTGSINVLEVNGQAAQDLVGVYDGVRFNSPNDLTVGRDGTIYFTDPDYQAPSPAPQAETRAYRVAPGSGAAVPIVEGRRQPNGITLSPDGGTLYVSASDGLWAYPVLPDGSLDAGEPFASGVIRSSDGMAVDCAGNLYTTSGQTVLIVDPSGTEVGRISVSGVQSVTNVAFGGLDNKTIYITSLGSGSRVGLFRYDSQIPGMPF